MRIGLGAQQGRGFRPDAAANHPKSRTWHARGTLPRGPHFCRTDMARTRGGDLEGHGTAQLSRVSTPPIMHTISSKASNRPVVIQNTMCTYIQNTIGASAQRAKRSSRHRASLHQDMSCLDATMLSNQKLADPAVLVMTHGHDLSQSKMN